MYLRRFYSKVTGLKRLPSQRKGKYKNQQKGDKTEQQGCEQLIFAKPISQHSLFSSKS